MPSQFLATKRSQPFLAWVSFLNPHNICEWARGESLPQGPIGTAPPAVHCPPLRANHGPQKNEPDIMTLMRQSYQNNPMFPVGNFDDARWRQYQWAYYRLIEKVDAQIGVVLQALRDNHLEENTIVVFAADHGDCQGAHRWNQKTVFYEESARVPFLVRYPGVVRTGLSDHLVNTGIDLMPTLCSLAGIEWPANGDGISLMKAATRTSATIHAPTSSLPMIWTRVDPSMEPSPTPKAAWSGASDTNTASTITANIESRWLTWKTIRERWLIWRAIHCTTRCLRAASADAGRVVRQVRYKMATGKRVR